MDWQKRQLKGSESRDNFKGWHKGLSKQFYASDLDLVLVEKSPPGIVAAIDFKTNGDTVSFAECILYNSLVAAGIPVFIVRATEMAPLNGCNEVTFADFTIERYLGGDWRPNPPRVELELVASGLSAGEFETWELELRKEYKERKKETVTDEGF